ncbi:MAG: hypothetical protein HYV60_15770 [Planctomycetia bacterium]|nr:hypothetical protein [Planctomycetia bacterium]
MLSGSQRHVRETDHRRGGLFIRFDAHRAIADDEHERGRHLTVIVGPDHACRIRRDRHSGAQVADHDLAIGSRLESHVTPRECCLGLIGNDDPDSVLDLNPLVTRRFVGLLASQFDGTRESSREDRLLLMVDM